VIQHDDAVGEGHDVLDHDDRGAPVADLPDELSDPGEGQFQPDSQLRVRRKQLLIRGLRRIGGHKPVNEPLPTEPIQLRVLDGGKA
jgi:hypothetical protein